MFGGWRDRPGPRYQRLASALLDAVDRRVLGAGARVPAERARAAAGGKDVTLGGGASAARQYLRAGLVDEMAISLVPGLLLGNGERLFEGVGADLHGLEHVRTVVAPGVVHLKLSRRTS